jgi:hypothetical protein
MGIQATREIEAATITRAAKKLRPTIASLAGRDPPGGPERLCEAR